MTAKSIQPIKCISTHIDCYSMHITKQTLSLLLKFVSSINYQLTEKDTYNTYLRIIVIQLPHITTLTRFLNTPLFIGDVFLADLMICSLITVIIGETMFMKGSTRYKGILFGTCKSFAGSIIVCVILTFHFRHLRHEECDNIFFDLSFWINSIEHEISIYLRLLAKCQYTYQHSIFHAFQGLEISM